MVLTRLMTNKKHQTLHIQVTIRTTRSVKITSQEPQISQTLVKIALLETMSTELHQSLNNFLMKEKYDKVE